MMHDQLLALSIRQPWVDLILRGLKQIEVREWEIKRRGPFLIHAAWPLDWRSIELFGYSDPLNLVRGGIVGYAEIADVVRLDPRDWLAGFGGHLVVHPRRPIQFGAVLRNVCSFEEVIRCPGKPGFFPPPTGSMAKLGQALERTGLAGA